jgi:hypothetical protein
MEGGLNINVKGRQNQSFIYLETEDDLNFKEIEDSLYL